MKKAREKAKMRPTNMSKTKLMEPPITKMGKGMNTIALLPESASPTSTSVKPVITKATPSINHPTGNLGDSGASRIPCSILAISAS